MRTSECKLALVEQAGGQGGAQFKQFRLRRKVEEPLNADASDPAGSTEQVPVIALAGISACS